jgi:hypothetical protein
MNIPLKIAEIGGEKLQTYIKTQIELEDKRVRLVEVESQIKLNMVAVDNMIGDYLPQGDRDYPHPPSWVDEHFKTRMIIPNLKRKSNRVVLDFMATEEILKGIRPLILEMKGLELEIAKLKRLQELREQGRA